jgi:hypothetical protein
MVVVNQFPGHKDKGTRFFIAFKQFGHPLLQEGRFSCLTSTAQCVYTGRVPGHPVEQRGSMDHGLFVQLSQMGILSNKCLRIFQVQVVRQKADIHCKAFRLLFFIHPIMNKFIH